MKTDTNNIQLVDFAPQYKTAFCELNEAWITQYFEMEETDRRSLHEPESYILEKGGFIVVALLENEPVGVCAAIKMNDGVYDFELAKMAVSPKAQGKGIGFLLGKAILEGAEARGAKKVYLETNTVLKPALRLYQRLGFSEIKGVESPYQRCNMQMEYVL